MSAQRLLLIGFGHVGRALARLLLERRQFPGLASLDVRVIGITTASHGALAVPSGVDLGAALAAIEQQGRFTPATPGFAAADSMQAIRTLDYDVLVELSPLSVATRGEPAAAHVRAALNRNKDVITCNKSPIAWHLRELTSLAASNRSRLLYEGAVMDGVPVFNLARHGLRGNVVTRVEGVLNSTSNIVLCALERGETLANAIRSAQQAGIAEADPGNDLMGWDGAVKLAALANVLMGADLTPEQVGREAITSTTATRARAALVKGFRLKAVCTAEREGATVRASLSLQELPADHPFALLRGAGSALRVSTDILGTFTITEEAPDLDTTAYAVISDLFALAEGKP